MRLTCRKRHEQIAFSQQEWEDTVFIISGGVLSCAISSQAEDWKGRNNFTIQAPRTQYH